MRPQLRRQAEGQTVVFPVRPGYAGRPVAVGMAGVVRHAEGTEAVNHPEADMVVVYRHAAGMPGPVRIADGRIVDLVSMYGRPVYLVSMAGAAGIADACRHEAGMVYARQHAADDLVPVVPVVPEVPVLMQVQMRNVVPPFRALLFAIRCARQFGVPRLIFLPGVV